MPEINANAATPEHAEAVRGLVLKLLDLAGNRAEPVALDALISAYATLVTSRSTHAMTADLKALDMVRFALFAKVQQQSRTSNRPSQPMEQVAQLANLVLLPDLAGHDHAVALSALLSVYRDLLSRYPCCAESHAAQLFALWQQASASAAAADAKPTTH